MQGQDVESAVDHAQDLRTLWAVFAGYFDATVVTRISYLHLPPLGAPDDMRPALLAEGFPEAAILRYLQERRYRHNPILGRAQRQLEPIYWDEVLDARPETTEEAGFIEEFTGLGLKYGVGIHVYGPHGREGQCGLGFRDGVLRLDPAVLHAFRRVCQLVHLRYCALVIPTLGPRPDLSSRESEVLAWVARGKSNGEIGEILGISSHTVEAHLRRIYLKLGVFDRISAAVRGIGVGLIHSAT